MDHRASTVSSENSCSVSHKRMTYVGMNGAWIIYKKFLENDVKHVFGFSGGANVLLLDCFHPDHHGGVAPIEFVKNSNESNCGYAAEGYAKVTGKAGVILVTSGPGLTNIVTPLQDALSDGVPLVAISAQVATTAPADAFQCCDATALTRACTKWNHKIKNLQELPAILDFAFELAHSSRPGPIHIDCPKDIQGAIYSQELVDEGGSYVADSGYLSFNCDGNMRMESLTLQISDGQLARVVKLIGESQRPILVVGQGANDCANELRQFVDSSNIPVTTTLHALGLIDQRHPLALRMLGMHGHPAPNFMIQKADLIIALGYRFDDRTIGNPALYAPGAREAQKRGRGGFIHVDVRVGEQNKVMEVAEFVNSDCRSFLEALNLKNCKPVERAEWLDLMADYQLKYPITIPASTHSELSIQMVIRELDRQIDSYRGNCVFTTGVGVHQMVAAQLVTWTKPRSMISSGSMGTMGTALGFAVGAKLARPSAVVISVDGDGSFNMSCNEMKTVMDLRLPVKIMVLNNSGEVMVEYWQRTFMGGRVYGVQNDNCDYNKLADAYGIRSVYCDLEANLRDAMDEFLTHAGAVLFHVKTRKTPCLPWVLPGRALNDMILDDGNSMHVN